MTVEIDASGIEELRSYFEVFPQIAAQSMSIAINYTTKGPGLDLAREMIEKQINYPEGYLDLPDRLFVSKFSTPSDLQGTITARDRATSLARFVPAGIPRIAGQQGKITIQEKRGGPAIPTKRMFFVGLNSGNVGLAIRLRPGEAFTSVNRYSPIEIFPDVFLLYAASVNQVFAEVAVDIKPQLTDILEEEFLRQLTFRTKASASG